MRLIAHAVLFGILSQSFQLKTSVHPLLRLNAHSFRENPSDRSLLRKLQEIRRTLQLDQLTVRELRVQIKELGGLSKGLYEKDELVRHLAYLIGNLNIFTSLDSFICS